MKAVVIQEDKSLKVEEKPVPKLGPNEILLRVITAGQNPTDWKTAAIAKPGCIVGCDAVGEVVELGLEVPTSEVKKGEIRFVFTRGSDSPDNGAFAEYVSSRWDITSVVPDNISPRQAASVPIPFCTAVQSLYSNLKLPQYPEKANGEWIIVYSGASAVGQFVIQLAKLAGLRVATTASEYRWPMLKALGADVLADYKDPDAVKKIKEATGDQIQYGMDCISEQGTIQKTQEFFRPEGGRLITTLFDLSGLPRPEVKTEFCLAYTCLGKDLYYDTTYFAYNPEDTKLWGKWCKLATTLFKEGKLQPSEVDVIGGLDKVSDGFELMKSGKHSKKIVFSIGE